MWKVIMDRIIDTEIKHYTEQHDYFTSRAKVGEYIRPIVFQPNIEPRESDLVAVFLEPGACHLVFRDEIAPFADLDTRYREIRKQMYGRAHDVESIEIYGNRVNFVNNFSLLNLYETSMHSANTEFWVGAIHSDTWNHMLSAGSQLVIKARGGYRQVNVPMYNGDRSAAERWQPK